MPVHIAAAIGTHDQCVPCEKEPGLTVIEVSNTPDLGTAQNAANTASTAKMTNENRRDRSLKSACAIFAI